MRIALLSYRTKAHVGGQGIYIRELSAALIARGHQVDVFSGQPYPGDLAPGVGLVRVPSLDLYRPDDPFRTPAWGELRDVVDMSEVVDMWTAGFGEPRTFGDRVARVLRAQPLAYDVIHDNQSLGYGIARLRRWGFPVVATIHHPISADRQVALAAATTWQERATTRRWFGFVPMQRRVAQQLSGVITVSAVSKTDVVNDFGVPADQVQVVPCGVDLEAFSPDLTASVPGRIVAIASADAPLKGVQYLLTALAALREQVPGAHLELVSALDPEGASAALIDQLGLGAIVRTHQNLSSGELAKLLASAQVVCVPSLYEGFCLPALEALASGRAIVATAVGGIPELVTDGVQGVLVAPGDQAALTAGLAKVLRDPQLATNLGAAGRTRAQAHYSWSAVAAETEAAYRRFLPLGNVC